MIDGCSVTVTDKLGNLKGTTGLGYEEFVGVNSGLTREGNWTRANIAAAIRSDLKKAWTTNHGRYQPGPKVSVRSKNYSGGGSITITIETYPGIQSCAYRDEVKLRAQIKQIASTYQRSSSHGQSDYHSTNFFLFVDYGGDLEAAIYNLGPRPEVTEHQYRQHAIANYASDEIEINDDADVSASDNGAFVKAWVWVGIEEFEAPDGEMEPDQVGPWAPATKYGDAPIWNPTGAKLDREVA